MFKGLIDWAFQLLDWLGIEPDRLKVLMPVLALYSILLALLGRYTRRRKKISDYKLGRDRTHVRIERLIFTERGDHIWFDRETRGEGAVPIGSVIDQERLAELVVQRVKNGGSTRDRAAAVVAKAGLAFGVIKAHDWSPKRILPAGHDFSLMMERVDQHLSGPSDAASQAAMFGREDDYETDKTAFVVLDMVGDDGFEMLHILMGNPAHLSRLDDAEFLARLKPVRRRYLRIFQPVFGWIAEETRKSKALFAAAESSIDDAAEDKAGEQAIVWTARIRT